MQLFHLIFQLMAFFAFLDVDFWRFFLVNIGSARNVGATGPGCGSPIKNA